MNSANTSFPHPDNHASTGSPLVLPVPNQGTSPHRTGLLGGVCQGDADHAPVQTIREVERLTRAFHAVRPAHVAALPWMIFTAMSWMALSCSWPS